MIATAQRTAIQFLQEEKKTIKLSATDYVNKDDMFVYNRTKHDAESFDTIEDLDWDEFYFEVKLDVSFQYSAYHSKQTYDNPEEKELEIKTQEVSASLIYCSQWNEEDKEMQEYFPTAEERRAIEKYLEENAEVW